MAVIQGHCRNLALNLKRSLHNMTAVVNYEDCFQKNIKANFNNLTMRHTIFLSLLHEIKNIWVNNYLKR